MYDFLLVRHCNYSSILYHLWVIGRWMIPWPWRSLKVVPFESFSAVFYLPSVVTMAICEILSIKEWCDLENRITVCSRLLEMAPFDRSHTSYYLPSEIFIPHLYLALPQVVSCDPVGMSWRCLMLIKLEWLGYRMVKKLWQYVKPFSSNTGMLRTDRPNCYINILRQYADAR